MSNVRQPHRGDLCIVPSGRRRGCGGGRGGRFLCRRLHGGRFPQLPVGLQGGEVVDGRKLDQGREDEGEADGDEPIHGGGVRNFGQGVAGADTESCHGQDGGDACTGRGEERWESGFFLFRMLCNSSHIIQYLAISVLKLMSFKQKRGFAIHECGMERFTHYGLLKFSINHWGGLVILHH